MWIFKWVFLFFFKQKTAYELRISDWSSDVCSSDLEMNLTQELVELPAADLREPVIEAGKKRKDRAKRQHIMEVGNHIIGVVQIVVDTTVGQYHAGNAADREEEIGRAHV